MKSDSEKTPSVDVEGLVWAMLDEQISAEDFGRLDVLLRDDRQARQLYLQCVQLHLDLASFYAVNGETEIRGPVGLPLSVSLPAGDATLADPAL